MTANLSASVLSRLLNLAKQRGDDYNLLLNRFALERLLLPPMQLEHFTALAQAQQTGRMQMPRPRIDIPDCSLL